LFDSFQLTAVAIGADKKILVGDYIFNSLPR
jgi:hypothetical protein